MSEDDSGSQRSTKDAVMVVFTVVATVAAIWSAVSAHRANEAASKALDRREADLSFRAFATESGDLRIIRTAGDLDPRLLEILLTPLFVSSDSRSPQSGDPVSVDFLRDFTTNSGVGYRISNYVAEICRVQERGTECSEDTIAGIQFLLVFSEDTKPGVVEM